MKVHPVQEFISTSQSMDELTELDQFYLSKLQDKFKLDEEIELLSPSQKTWLQQIFAERWDSVAWNPNKKERIFSTSFDYTLNQKGSNAAWINLAAQVEKEFGKPSIEILMPTLKNKVDPNTFLRSDGVDLSDLYIGEDGETWYSIKGLLNRVKLKQRFSTYDTVKYSPPRPLTLNELLKIRFKGQQDPTVWSNFNQNYISKWSLKGTVPKQLLPSLLEILEIYFNPLDPTEKQIIIRQKLMALSRSLAECPIDDVNCLYGQIIEVGSNKIFLINILLDLLYENPADINDKLLGVAKWLFKYDGSLILYRDKARASMELVARGSISLEQAIQNIKDDYHPSLKELYKDLKAGPWFDLKQLASFIKLMVDVVPNGVKAKLLKSIEKNEENGCIEESIVHLIASLYDWRWSQIKGTSKDYTVEQMEANEKWIRLAQLLCGAGHIPKNYYRFLMPTITYDLDPIQLECITSYPLSYYLLSQDNRELILIRNCIEYFKEYGYFCNCNTKTPMPFTKVEVDRLQYIDRRFRKFISSAISAKIDEEPISANTLNAIYTLVDRSMYTIGLQFAQDYNQEQSNHAQIAYTQFYQFLHQLPEDEKCRLNAQRILLNGKYMSFGQVMEKIKGGECIAVYGQYFVKLITDYQPYRHFKQEIEDRLPLKDMRAKSKKKIFYDYKHIDVDEAHRRLKIIALSLLEVQYQPRDQKENRTIAQWLGQWSGIMKDIMKILIDSLQSVDVNQPKITYSRIIESIVKPYCSNGKQSGYAYPLLLSIQDESLFTKKFSWIQPNRLLQALSMFSLIDKLKKSEMVEEVYDDCLKICMQNDHDSIKEVSIGFRFFKLIQSLDASHRAVFFSLLENVTTDIPLDSFFQEYILLRLIAIGLGPKDTKGQLFFKMDTNVIFKNLLKDRLKPQSTSLNKKLSDLYIGIQNIDKSIISDQNKSLMTQYLSKLINGVILKEESDSQLSCLDKKLSL